MGVFYDYPWPGNVRELQNVVERMMNFSRQTEWTVDLIPPEILECAAG
jgi:arginine utilization regulatory protein